MINVCMLRSWALHEFCYMPFHLYRGVFFLLSPCFRRSICSCLWPRNFASVAPFWAYSISKCSRQRVHHFIALHHFHLSSSWCPKCCWKRAMWCNCQICFSKWHFVIFAMIYVCMLWSWALHVFCYMPCHIYRGVCHVFLWYLWWLARACKVAYSMMLNSGT